MRRQLPPLLALRVFEATGRHLSFSRAALELHVTQGAVSRQIKILETYLRAPLFRRLTRKIELTEFGARYLTAVSAALDAIEQATQAATTSKTTLTVSIAHTTASTWLMPRLASFIEAHNDIHVNVVTSMEPVDFETEDIDVAIRLGRLPGKRYRPEQPQIPREMVVIWKNVIAEYLWDELLTPVCSKSLLASGPPLAKPEDLRNHTLIHVTPRPTAWSDWFRASGVPVIKGRATLEFGHFITALEAARHKRGVAIAPTLFLDQLEWRDDLVCPLPSSVKSAGEYYFLCRERDADTRKIRLFRKWLLRQQMAKPASKDQRRIRKPPTAPS